MKVRDRFRVTGFGSAAGASASASTSSVAASGADTLEAAARRCASITLSSSYDNGIQVLWKVLDNRWTH